MRFKLQLQTEPNVSIPINYQYPLSAAIYKIIAKGDKEYAAFLHGKGYGKGFKLFTFSQIITPFEIDGEQKDRMTLLSNEATFHISFHLPQAMESFVKGLFKSEYIDIADKKSKARFYVKNIESLHNPIVSYNENEIVTIKVKPNSPIVTGLIKENGKYDFLSPHDSQFIDCLIYNWRSKIETCYDLATATNALLMMELIPMRLPPKSRLITIKADTDATTRIRGWMNFELKITGEKKYVEILFNSGIGIYNAQGMGSVEVVEKKNNIKVKLKKYDNI